ncbi:hypothetical protein ABHV46_10945 [Asaia sp. BMEF1]|uniref:hypothetical protein n=1 Tax=Asaia sp. BMEF1 TaxID=3155932 RepID=UPI003F67AA7C
MNDITQLERLQKWAMHYHSAIITPGQDGDVRFVEAAKSQQLSRRLEEQVLASLSHFADLLGPLERELAGFLRKEAVLPILQDVSSVLTSRLAGLGTHEVQTEVLLSWLAETETSDSSSGCADGESAGELPTPSRTDDALPLKHAASVTVFPSEEKGEHP